MLKCLATVHMGGAELIFINAFNKNVPLKVKRALLNKIKLYCVSLQPSTVLKTRLIL